MGKHLAPVLTRQLITRLPEGCFVVSGLLDPDGRALFAHRIGRADSRDVVWRRAKVAEVTQRRCRILWDERDFEAA